MKSGLLVHAICQLLKFPTQLIILTLKTAHLDHDEDDDDDVCLIFIILVHYHSIYACKKYTKKSKSIPWWQYDKNDQELQKWSYEIMIV